MELQRFAPVSVRVQRGAEGCIGCGSEVGVRCVQIAPISKRATKFIFGLLVRNPHIPILDVHDLHSVRF